MKSRKSTWFFLWAVYVAIASYDEFVLGLFFRGCGAVGPYSVWRLTLRAFDLLADDGRTIPVPILLEGEESVVEFIDLPYNGVSLTISRVFFHSQPECAWSSLTSRHPIGEWTGSSAVAERPRDALCPSVVSLNKIITRAKSLIVL